MSEERTLSSKLIFDGRAIKLRVDTVQKPNGEITTREIVEHADCIATVALDKDNNVLLVRQFRKAVEDRLLEIPAGGIDQGEDPEAAVRRELREETGYLPRRIERIGGYYLTPGYCKEYLHLYISSDLVHSPLMAEDTEGIELVRAPIRQIPRLIRTGEICDAKSIAGLYAFLDHYKRQKSHV